MNHDFFTRFYPRIIDVSHRGRDYWERYRYEMYRDSAVVHNLVLVLKGEGEYEHNGRTTALSPGHLFHYGVGQRFKLVSSQASPLTYYSLHYDYRMLKWESSALHVGESEGALPFKPTFKIRDFDKLQAIFGQLHAIWTGKSNGYEWQARMAFMELLREIAKQHESDNEERDDYSAKLIELSVAFIKSNFCRRLERREMADNASLSISYYSTLFKKETGYSPVQYVNRLRIDLAKQLLRTTNLPISTIARDVGFEDPLYFAKVFAKENGMAPREYRKV